MRREWNVFKLSPFTGKAVIPNQSNPIKISKFTQQKKPIRKEGLKYLSFSAEFMPRH